MSEIVENLATQRVVMDGALSEVLECILRNLPAFDVCRLSVVCSNWNLVTNENQLWKWVCERDGVIEQQLTLTTLEQQQGCYYKCLYKKYAKVMKRWMAGESAGVTTFTKDLLTPNGERFRGKCWAVSSSFILASTVHHPPVPTDGLIYIYCASTGEYMHTLSGLPAIPKFVLESNDELMVAAYIGESSFVCVWMVQTSECLHSLDHPYNVQGIALYGQMLAVAFRGGVFVWNVHNGQSLHQLVGPDSADALVLDSDHLAVYTDLFFDPIVHLWNITTGAHLFTCNQARHVYKMMLDTGTHSLICQNLGVCNVWDSETGACRAIINANHCHADYGNRVRLRQEDTVVIYTYGDEENQADFFADMLVHDGKLIIVCSATTDHMMTSFANLLL